MNHLVSFNHQILPADQSFLSAVSSAAFYGKSVFTTVAIFNEKPFLWEKHWRRLRENALKIGIDLSGHNEDSVKAALLPLISQNNLKKGRTRLTLFDERTSKIWNATAEERTSLLITTAEFQDSKDQYALTVSPFPVNSKSPLAGVKSGNYLENLMSLEEAVNRGFDEAMRLNEHGEIASAAMTNIFLVKNEKIFTPAIESGCLAGTTREFLLENYSIEEKRVGLDELIEAEEIFLTSAGIGIKSVRCLDSKMFGGEITKNVKQFFDEAVGSL